MENLKESLEMGVVPAMATPMMADGQGVEMRGVGPLVSFLIGAGVKGLFVGGTTGEGILLPAGQRQRLHEETMKAVSGRVPVLLHVGANTTAEAVLLADHAAKIGAEAIVAVTPSFYPLNDEGLLAYYQAIAQAAPQTALFAYDIPQQATNGIGPALLERLIDQVATLVGLKTSRPDAQAVRQLLDVASGRVLVYAGNERIALGLLALGANGLISGLSTAVPEPFVALTAAFAAGDWVAAGRQQQLINRLLDLLPAGARIGALKTILNQRGVPAGIAVPPHPTPAHLPLWSQIQTILG